MKTKFILLLCALNLVQLSFASDPYYYESISNPSKTIDYLFGLYTKGYSVGKASDDKEYVIYSGAIVNSSSSSLVWENYHVIVVKNNGDMVISYTTAATTGDYASSFTVSPKSSHFYWVAFHDVFKPEDIAQVYLLDKSILKSFSLIKNKQVDENLNSAISVKESTGNSQNCTLFPLYGITLAKTTEKELSQMGVRAKHTDSSTNEPYKYYKVNGLNFWYENSLADHMYMTYSDPMPTQWTECGFDWNLSFNEWKSLLEKSGYQITITKSPKSQLYDGRQTLSADVTAIKEFSAGKTLKLRFDFDYGNSSSVDGKKTLYSLSISIY